MKDFLPFSDVMSKRHELISLRSKSPEINRAKLKIPITESEVAVNEELMGILLHAF